MAAKINFAQPAATLPLNLGSVAEAARTSKIIDRSLVAWPQVNTDPNPWGFSKPQQRVFWSTVGGAAAGFGALALTLPPGVLSVVSGIIAGACAVVGAVATLTGAPDARQRHAYDARLDQARELIAGGDYSKAYEVLAAGQELFLSSPRVLGTMAVLAHKLGHTVESANYFQKWFAALKAEPQTADTGALRQAHLTHALCEFELGHRDSSRASAEVVVALSQALGPQPFNAELNTERALAGGLVAAGTPRRLFSRV